MSVICRFPFKVGYKPYQYFLTLSISDRNRGLRQGLAVPHGDHREERPAHQGDDCRGEVGQLNMAAGCQLS